MYQVMKRQNKRQSRPEQNDVPEAQENKQPAGDAKRKPLEATVEDLIQLFEERRDRPNEKPIVFVGAGFSKTGNIPLAKAICEDIEKRYGHISTIQTLKKAKNDGYFQGNYYAELMRQLLPNQRKELLKSYIDQSNVNPAHMYLAQLYKQGYIDYILTVNFDDLILRTLALYDEFPPTYDFAIIRKNDIGTCIPNTGSILYLHGQKHGFRLLNTYEEMEATKEVVPILLREIMGKRPWIFIGYSGNDPIRDYIDDLGIYEHGLYWLALEKEELNQGVESIVCKDGARLVRIEGADEAMTAIYKGLAGEQVIPFKLLGRLALLKTKVTDIDINQHHSEKKEESLFQRNLYQLEIRVIHILLSARYEEKEIEYLYQQYNEWEKKNTNKGMSNEDIDNLKEQFALLYFYRGIALGKLSISKIEEYGKECLKEACEKFEIATKFNSNRHTVYYNWGVALGKLSELKTGEEKEKCLQEECKKYKEAIKLKPDYYKAYKNWGVTLNELSELKTGEKKEELLQEACEKYKQSIKLKPDQYTAYNNWGTALGKLSYRKIGEEKEKYLQEACEKFELATNFNSDYYEAYNNWGVALEELSELKTGKEKEQLKHEAEEKFAKAKELQERTS